MYPRIQFVGYLFLIWHYGKSSCFGLKLDSDYSHCDYGGIYCQLNYSVNLRLVVIFASRFCDMTKYVERGSMARINILVLFTGGFAYSIVLGRGNHETIGLNPQHTATTLHYRLR